MGDSSEEDSDEEDSDNDDDDEETMKNMEYSHLPFTMVIMTRCLPTHLLWIEIKSHPIDPRRRHMIISPMIGLRGIALDWRG
jgi:hypothetical protein